MTIKIYTNNEIELNGEPTGLAVSQHQSGTIVYDYKTGEACMMPRDRYTLASNNVPDNPKVGSLAQFEKDIISLLITQSSEFRRCC